MNLIFMSPGDLNGDKSKSNKSRLSSSIFFLSKIMQLIWEQFSMPFFKLQDTQNPFQNTIAQCLKSSYNANKLNINTKVKKNRFSIRQVEVWGQSPSTPNRGQYAFRLATRPHPGALSLLPWEPFGAFIFLCSCSLQAKGLCLPCSWSQNLDPTVEWAFFLSFFYFLFIYSYVHILFGSFLPPAPHPLPFPATPSLPGRTCSALISNFVEEKT
jgi:hypothetical protein